MPAPSKVDAPTAASDVLAVGFNAVPLSRWATLFRQLCRSQPGLAISWKLLPFPRTNRSPLEEVDVALLCEPPAHRDVSTLALKREPRVVVLAACHPLAGRPSLTVAEVLDETFPGCDPSMHPRWKSFWFLEEERGGPAKLSNDRIATAGAGFAAIASGRAIATVPASLVAALPHPGVMAVPLLDARPATLALAWRSGHGNPASDALVALAMETVGGEARPSSAGTSAEDSETRDEAPSGGCPMCGSSTFDSDFWDGSLFLVCRECGWAVEVPRPG